MQLYVANKGYSSWSQRPWLVLRHFGIPFEDRVLPMFLPESKARFAEVTPNGKLPCLIDGDIKVWDSLAIIEYVAEGHPELAIWPRDRAARAHARAISAEMHSGFTGLRQHYSSNWRKSFPWKERGGEAPRQDAERIFAIWREARARFGAGGPFLYGAFSAADAMYAPVVGRFHSYNWPVDPDIRAYMDAVRALPAHQDWIAAGQAEPWSVEHYDNPE